MKKSVLNILLSAVLLGSFSCIKHKEEVAPSAPVYDIPATYNYDNAAANYADAKTLLSGMTKLSDSIKAGNTPNRKVTAAALRDIFNNANSPLTLKSVTESSFHTTVDTYFDQIETASQSTTAGSEGVAGVIFSNDGKRKKLYDAKGNAVYELIEKGLMGAFQYHQITSVYLSDAKIGAGISTTQKQKNWDMAFGLIGLPVDYPKTAGAGYWAGYMGAVGVALDSNNTKIMKAFIKGRAAINNNDNAGVTAAANTIKKELDRTAAGMTLRYLKSAKASLLASPVDHGPKSGAISEGKGFLSTLKYNPSKAITDAQITTLTNSFGTDNWKVTEAILNQAINDIATIYSLDASKF